MFTKLSSALQLVPDPIVLTQADEPDNPASVAMRGNTVYVVSAAYTTGDDPNMIVAHFNTN